MSLCMHLYYTGKGGAAFAFVREMEESGLAAAIRGEPGNLKYAYFQDLADPETVLLVDEWADQAALDAHHATPMMGELARLREKYDLHMRSGRYLSDEEGAPAGDAAFLRS